MKIVLLVSVFIYLIYTFRYALILRNSLLFTGRLKVLHHVLIWLIPFVWIWLLKSFSKTEPGSHEVPEKADHIPFDNAHGPVG